MIAAPVPLPMAVSGCALGDGELAHQLERYQELARAVTEVKRHGPTLLVMFNSAIDTRLLHDTIAIERRCCSFLTIDYRPSELTLSISTDPAHSEAIAALSAALTSTIPARRSTP